MGGETISDTTNTGLLDEQVLKFLAVAFLAPLVAGILTIIAARIGAAGTLRRLEVPEKRLLVTRGLLGDEELDRPTKLALRAQLNHIAGELVGEFHSPPDLEAGGGGEATKVKPWDEYSLTRRYLFLPAASIRFSWLAIGIYYYFGSAFLIIGSLQLFEYILFLFSPDEAVGINSENGGVLLGFLAFWFLIRLWVRNNYRNYEQIEADKTKIRFERVPT